MSVSSVCRIVELIGEEGVAELWLRNHGTVSRAYARDLRQQFTQMGSKLLMFIEGLLQSHDLNSVSPIITFLFPVEVWHSSLVRTSHPHLLSMATVGASTEFHLQRARRRSVASQLLKVGLPVGFKDRMPPNVEVAVNQWTREALQQPYWRGMAETVRDDVADAVAKGARDGKSGPEVAARLRTVLGANASAKRAEMIARTESTGALNAGHLASQSELNKMGLLKGRKWLSILDANTRQDHRKMNGVMVEPGELFMVGGEPADHPGDYMLTAKQRCNCRCTIMSVLKSPDEIEADEVPLDPTVRPSSSGFAHNFAANPEDREATEDRLEKLFGHRVSMEEAAKLAGALHPGDVKIEEGGQGGTSVSVYVRTADYTMTRTFERYRGKLVCHNDHFALLRQEDKGSGLGTQILTQQVQVLSEKGFDRIETYAAGEGTKYTGGKSSYYNGYYTWPRLGYDAPIPKMQRDKLPANLASAKRLSDLMRTEQGRAWWKENGKGLSMKFDLKAESKSRQVLEAYGQEKKKVRSLDQAHHEEIPLSEQEERALDRAWARLDAQWRAEEVRP